MFDRIDQGIYWDRLWRLVDGCTPCSPGCGEIEKGGGCWVAREAKVRTFGAKDLLGPDGRWDGQIRLRYNNLDLPLRTRKPTSWLILNDLFHESVDEDFIEQAIMTMTQRPEHIFWVLTKRAKRMKQWIYDTYNPPNFLNMFPNIWPGVSVCTPDELFKVDELLKIQAAIRWVSIEPMLGPIEFKPLQVGYDCGGKYTIRPRVDWVVLGGESGPGARPMHPQDPRDVRDQCQMAGISFFFKQWGEWLPITEIDLQKDPLEYSDYIFPRREAEIEKKLLPLQAFRVGRKKAGRLLDGRTWNELPEVR